MEDNDLVYSRHCQRITIDGKTIDLQIFGTGNNDWILEVVDSEGNSIAWDGLFASDDDAFQEFEKTLAEEGIDSILNTKEMSD